jgi:hypothetical protein
LSDTKLQIQQIASAIYSKSHALNRWCNQPLTPWKRPPVTSTLLLPGHKHVEHVVLLDVVDSLFVGDHGEVVAIKLEDLVVHTQAGLAGGAVFIDVCHIDALEKE